MLQEPFFCHLDTTVMSNFIRNAKRAVVYAGPGIHLLPAQAMVEVSERLGTDMLTVNVDLDERVIRMGYGEFKAISLLKKAGIPLNHSPNLRSALLIVDDKGYSFTPTALYIEAENKHPTAFNAIRLMKDQVKEALARLSPAAKAIAIAQSKTPEEKEHLSNLELDVDSSPIQEEDIYEVKISLTKAPPVNFDLARQVRVYEAYLQYVELSLSGVAIQRHRLTLPDSLQKLGGSDKEIEGRLKTTFDLLEKNGPLSSKPLENKLNDIRKDFTRSLGKSHGRVLLKSSKVLFEQRIEEFQSQLAEHAKNVSKKLQFQIDKSKSSVSDYYLPIVQKNIPDELIAGLLTNTPPSEEELKIWIIRQLDKVFPTAEQLINIMKLEVRYKDMTFETLNHKNFLTSVSKAFPDIDWNKAHEEFIAASER